MEDDAGQAEDGSEKSNLSAWPGIAENVRARVLEGACKILVYTRETRTDRLNELQQQIQSSFDEPAEGAPARAQAVTQASILLLTNQQSTVWLQIGISLGQASSTAGITQPNTFQNRGAKGEREPPGPPAPIVLIFTPNAERYQSLKP